MEEKEKGMDWEKGGGEKEGSRKGWEEEGRGTGATWSCSAPHALYVPFAPPSSAGEGHS